MIDRVLMYRSARKQSRLFVQQVADALKNGKLDEAIAIAERNSKSHIARAVAAVLALLSFNYLTNRVEPFNSETINSCWAALIGYFQIRQSERRKSSIS
jgi:hypothetical protein